jgi:hypothetical protein
MSLAFASLVSIGDLNPQLALWATDMPPAMRAFSNIIRSDPTSELTRRGDYIQRSIQSIKL